MKQICVYGGTTEGRKLAQRLADAGIIVHVYVATEYGEQVMEEGERISVFTGRLDVAAMRALYEREEYTAVVDATHPFAIEVTKNIKESLQDTTIPYFRLLRDVGETKETEECYYYNTIEDCVNGLTQTTGTIFLTTGSKELPYFCIPGIKERLVVRVLPSMESIGLCYEHGLLGRQIIAMQGPFSTQSNLAQLKQVKAAHVVTKQTGKTGGLPEKLEAARIAGATVHMICCQEKTTQESDTLDGICEKLSQLCGCKIGKKPEKMQVCLAGIGMGSPLGMTGEVREAIKEADVVFGATRMLALCPKEKETYPYYRAEEILPILKDGYEKKGWRRSVILFSGDPGFYSGAQKMAEALAECGFVSTRILPGISALVAFAARLSCAWQDAGLYSTHGIAAATWTAQFCEVAQFESKSFFLTSGKEDVARMCALLKELGGLKVGDVFAYGYQLGYEEEEVASIDLDNPPKKEGLYVVYLHRAQPMMKKLTPGIPDAMFLRDKVPMTKEEMRGLILCYMNLHQHSVVYDIGSGTGSIAVEIARMHPSIQVYALERKWEAVELLKKNLTKFRLHNVTAIHAMAPEGLEGLPRADIAFLGGTGGNLTKILQALYEINPGMQILFTAVTMESVAAMEAAQKESSFLTMETILLQASRVKSVGSYRMLSANNPVYLYVGQFSKKGEGDDTES
ncbi:precorrin-6Y C5,15-methyltransferase (decarboxylating) [Lachnospiraceae bacterium XBB1006]|nr:precorrin-6Y C5,15-methyltransferase (decarboxylating) [Lachnospiraceae bacterium XBB1006]